MILIVGKRHAACAYCRTGETVFATITIIIINIGTAIILTEWNSDGHGGSNNSSGDYAGSEVINVGSFRNDGDDGNMVVATMGQKAHVLPIVF